MLCKKIQLRINDLLLLDPIESQNHCVPETPTSTSAHEPWNGRRTVSQAPPRFADDQPSSILAISCGRKTCAQHVIVIEKTQPNIPRLHRALSLYPTVRSLDNEIVINAFPSIGERPIEREDDRAARLEARRLEIGEVDAKATIFRRAVLDGTPTIRAPVD